MDPLDDLPPELAPQARLLEEQRPVPRAAFRGALGRHLRDRAQGLAMIPGMRRGALAYSASGVGLLLVAFAGVLGLGPLAA